MDINYITISDLNRYIKAKFDTDIHLNKVYLKGEISNFKHHTRGHLYFTLKDEGSRLNAVMFASSASLLKFEPEDGMKVLVSGRISVYEATGNYQIYVDDMQVDGLGSLYIEYEKLKKKLSEEGLFAAEHKKKMPRFPKKIGIITASTGAAIRDILSTIKRRYPICETILFPALVQGVGAKESIVKQLETAQNYDLDLIICGRGGGSIEDLWAFNEEIVARAIYACKIPVISAVGHEPDFTIVDYVADLRAPTPTGAAEMAVPNMYDIFKYLDQISIRLHENISSNIKHKKDKLTTLSESYVLKNPFVSYEIKEQKLDSYVDILNKHMKTILEKSSLNLDKLSNSYILQNPLTLLDTRRNKMSLIIKSLDLLNPLGILEKGYSIVSKDNLTIKDIKEIKKDDIIYIKLHKGSITAKVNEVKE